MAEDLVRRTVGGLHEALLPRLGGVPRDAVTIDLGCGSGAWLARLASAGYTNLTGVDHAPPAGADFVQADLEAPGALVAARRGTCDLVTAIEVVEHIANQGEFWGLVAALLKPGGRALVTTPNVHSLPSRLRWLFSGRLRQFDDRGDATHVTPVLLPLLPRVLAPRGLELGETWSYPPRGYVAMRPALRALFRTLAFADRRSGDTLCFWVHKRSAR